MKNAFTICFLFCSLHAAAQPFLFKNITINEGLTQNSVIDVVQDETGFMWFATQDGLNRFDGKDFLVFEKTFDDITTPTGGRLGKIITVGRNFLWMITTNGKLEQLDLSTHEIQSVNSLPGLDKALPSLRCLMQDRTGNVWLGTENQGIIVYDPVRQRTVRYNVQQSLICNNTVNALFQDSQQQVWVLTQSGITVFAKEKKVASFSCDSASAASAPIRYSCITEDRNGNIWIGSYGKGLWIKTKDNSYLRSADQVISSLYTNDLVIETILADRAGNVWIGTYGKGAWVYKDTTVHQLLNDKSNSYSIGFNDVLSIYEDGSGGIWLGTDGGGVSYYNRQLNNFNLISTNNVPADIGIAPVRSITADNNGNIWLGTSSKGFTSINPDQKKYRSYRLNAYNNQTSNPDRIVSLYADADNDIWIGTQANGLAIFDPRLQSYKEWFHPLAAGEQKIPDHTIWCMYPAGKRAVWAGMHNGYLAFIDKEKGLVWSFNLSTDTLGAIQGNAIRSLAPMNDSVLITAQEKGIVYLFNTKSKRIESYCKKLNQYLAAQQAVIKSIYYRAPNLWIGTLGKGVLVYNFDKETLDTITSEKGLPNNTVYAIIDDDKGNLWMSTNKGICRLKYPDLPENVGHSFFTTFTIADGLQGNEFNTGAYFKDSKGIIYLGGINGLNYFNPAQLPENSDEVRVAVTDIIVDNESVKKDTVITFKKLLNLSYLYRSVAFRFAALDFASAGRYNYYYTMEGYDKQWIDAGNRNYITYTNLPPGNYTFRIRASIPGADVQSNITSVNIVVAPPFWKTWWFITAAVTAVALGLYNIYRSRINRLLQLQTVRNRIATDLHDDIGSALTNIHMLSAITAKKLGEPEEAAKYLKRIDEEVGTSGQALDDIIWSVNSTNDTLEDTVARMRRYAAELFDTNEHIRCVLEFDENFAYYKLSMEQRRDVYLVYKEALNNILKHSGARNVWVNIGLRSSRLFLYVKDDGKGFDVEMVTHRNGLKNMKARAQKWKGRLSIVSGNEGSVLDVEFPL